jgi:uracil-DNA glycosylase
MTIPIPSSCFGCPFYAYRFDPDNSFTPDYIVPGSRVFFLAQNPGKDEALGHELVRRHYHGGGAHSDEFRQVRPQPLIGATGQTFNNRFLPLAQLTRGEVSLGNVIRCRPGKALGLPKADELPPITATMKLESSKADIVKALKHCKDAHFNPPSSTEVVVTMGRHAMFIMTGLTKDEDIYDDHKRKPSALENWRGYAVEVGDYRDVRTVDVSKYHSLQSGRVVFMTMHIAALFYGDNKKFYHATLQDFHKIGRLLRKEWPTDLPQYSIVPPQNWPSYASFDTEYNPETAELYRWSMCDTSNNLYCVDIAHTYRSVIPIKPHATVLIQNALADIHYLHRIVDIDKVKVEDLMLAHSVLWTGEPHSLNYINSVYGTVNRYKHLSSDDPQLYSALDAWEPMKMWRQYFIPEFKRDRQSWSVYKRFRLPLIPIIDKAQRSGAALDSQKLDEVKSILQGRIEEYQKKAKEITGDKFFNLGGSKRMKEEIYG